MTGSTVRKAIFPVAGLGTRFLPATKAVPKELLTLVDRPLIQYALDEARAAGIEQFIFVTSRGKTNLEDYFDAAPDLEASLAERGKARLLEAVRATTLDCGQIASVRQPRPLGLGHAVWCARHLIGDEPFAVMLPDDVVTSATPCLKQMVDVHAETGGSVIAAMEVAPEQTGSYGILDVMPSAGRVAPVRGIVEKPDPSEAPSNLAVIGRYILTPEVFDHLGSGTRGAGGEIQLTDAIAAGIAQGRSTFAYRFSGQRFDCGSKAGFLQATVAFALADPDLGEAFEDFLHAVMAMRKAAE
ncbi:MAG: UTP--glucose-phosphate uridylyltransferase [Pseudomonadota bacterium]|jgi:UTP--glucose-1-phosphate uridylyltransferase